MNSIAADGKYSREQIEQMEYTLVTVVFEVIKIILVIGIFALFGYFDKVIIITGVMCMVKPFIGGYHEDTQLKCFVATMLVTTGILILSLQCNLSFIGNCILIFLSIFCIWNQAPIINSKMPITSSQLIESNRIRGIYASIICGLLAIILYDFSSYYSLITWTVFIETMLMFNKRES
jgi:accessory gene regulator B